MATSTIHLKWFNPVQIEWKNDSLASLNGTNPFIVVADSGAVSLEMEAELRRQWGNSCFFWIWQQAKHSSLQAAQDLAREIWPIWHQHPNAVLLAIGGGTTLDLAKIVRFELTDLDCASDIWRANKLPQQYQRHTLWCAPTTSGTGSEVTPWATLWDIDIASPLKRSWHVPQGFPDRALIDPVLTLSCPKSLTRDTALDTLSHALESLWSHKANDLTRPLAIESANIVLRTLPDLLVSPQDLRLRNQMSKASLLAGLAMSQTQTALAHALSYDLTLHEGLPHGHACAVWLVMVMDMATRQSIEVQQDMSMIFSDASRSMPFQLTEWLKELGIESRDLRDTPAGQVQLQQALDSTRGRNFIASAT